MIEMVETDRSLPRWLALLAGLVIGLSLGLTYQWVIVPVEIINSHPALLRSDYRADWIQMTALSYVAEGNVDRVRLRLEGLEEEDIAEAVGALIEAYAAAGRPADTMRRLSTLAETLGVRTPAMLVYLQTPTPRLGPVAAASPTPSSSPSPSPLPSPFPSPTIAPSPSPTVTPTLWLTGTPLSPSPTPTITPTSPITGPTSLSPLATPSLPPTPTPPLARRLALADLEQICEPGEDPRIEVIIRDERGDGVAGVVVWLAWADGTDRAVTGLKPDQGNGYADFDVRSGERYSLGVEELTRPLATDLQITTCPVSEEEEEEEAIIGSWRVVLQPGER